MSTPRKVQCTVERVTDHGDMVYTVDLKPLRPIPAFRPGQFLHLALDDYDPSRFWPESRVFSIASPPGERNRLRVVYSVKGVYTTRMAKDLCSGLGVWVKMPYGEFVVDGTADAVLIAGGTGITAFQAFIEGLVPDHPRKVVLLYGARRPGLLLGREMLEEKQRKVASFRAFFFSETGVPSSDPAPGTTLPGRTNLNAIEDCTVSDSTVYYLAGPPAMVAAIRVDLEHTGVTGKSIRVDAWE